MITIAVKGVPELEAKFKELDGVLRKEIRATLSTFGPEVARYVTGSLLSGQMLRINTPDAGLRHGMTSKMFERADSIQVAIFPKSNSPLWMLGSGMKERTISVRGRRNKSLDVRGQRQVLIRKGKYAGTYRTRTYVAKKGYDGGYQRRHHLHKVPFMEAAFHQWKDEARKRMEAAIGKAVSTYGPG